MNEKLNSYNWIKKLTDLNTENSFNVLHNTLIEAFNAIMPEKTKLINSKPKKHEPWITKGIRNSIPRQKQLYKRTIQYNHDNDALEKYKTYRTTLQQVKRRAKAYYYRNKCKEFKNNTRKLWNVINTITGKRQTKQTTIESLTIQGKSVTNPNEITRELGNYFANVGKDFASKIPPGKQDINHYLNKIPQNENSIFLTPTNKREICKLIDSLKNKNSSGHDGISNKILKGITQSISEPLSIIFNKSMEEGIFPTEMKKADTVPLHKSKSREDKNNYRLISLLLTVSKLLEQVIYTRTYNFLIKYNQICNSQYGFRKGHSCQDAVAQLIDEVVKNKDEGLYTIGVFLDLSKAFDTLEHNVLLDKLYIYGIRGIALKWYKSYLTDRMLRVKCMVASSSKQEYSDYEEVTYSTPQGSCLGPLLFLIFSNDLYRHLDYFNNLQFADDTTIYKGHRNLRYLIWCIEHDLNNLNDKFSANKLTLNIGKSVHMTFGKNKTKIQTKIKLGTTELPKVETVKFLGMWLDQNLNWDEHLSKLKLRVRRNMNMLQIGINLLDTQAKKILYYAQIYSHLSYGLTLWGNMISSTKLDCLQKLQNKCIRKIDVHEKKVEKTYQKHKIMKLKEALRLENCKLAYRLEHKMLPINLQQLFNTNQRGMCLKKIHNYGTRNKMLPNIARTHSKLYSTSYLCNSLREYQMIGTEIRQAKSLKLFNSILKKKILTC